MALLFSLIALITATALGVGVVALASEGTDDHLVIQRHTPIRIEGSTPLAPVPSTDTPAEVPLVTRDRPGATAAETPRSVTFNSWKSEIHARNGFTLWDHVRISSQQDRRAFLLGTAIQIHVPEIAATPGPLYAPSP